MELAVRAIRSGGQTGADRAALDWALKYDIPHKGWCPHGRLAEDGRIHDRYQLQETPTDNYAERTEWNVRDADATLIIALGRPLTGGSLQTREFAQKLGKPWLHLDGTMSPSKEFFDLWLSLRLPNAVPIELNVAGPREANQPGTYQVTMRTLDLLVFGEVKD